jgi:hypothetical protein
MERELFLTVNGWMTDSADKEPSHLDHNNSDPAHTNLKVLDHTFLALYADPAIGKDFEKKEMVCPRGSP